MLRLVAVGALALATFGSAGCLYCKACVPLATVHLTSRAGTPLPFASIVVTSSLGRMDRYACDEPDGGDAGAACIADGVSFSSDPKEELTVTATAQSGERGSITVTPSYVKTAESICGPCLSADITLLLE